MLDPPGGGGVLGCTSDVQVRRPFWFEISDRGLFWLRNLLVDVFWVEIRGVASIYARAYS